LTKRFSPASLDGRTGVEISARSPSRRADDEGAGFDRHIHGYVAATLGREIVAGVYPPGSLLPNVPEVCERFGVSRTVLREAYNLLAGKALIAARPKVGTRVRPRSEWQIFDPDVLAWHLEAGPGEAIEQIAEAFGRMERFRDGQSGLIEADLDFHMAILGATSNPFLKALGGLIHASLQCSFRFSWEGAARIQDDRLRQHKLVLDAIQEGAPSRARRRMSELLRDSLDDARRSPPKTAR